MNSETFEIADKIGLFTAEDIRFVHAVLGEDAPKLAEVCAALNDPETRYDLLDSLPLLEELDTETGCAVSPYFYHWVRSRALLLSAGIFEADYTDLVALAALRLCEMHLEQIQRVEMVSPALPVQLSIIRSKDLREANHHTVQIVGEYSGLEMVLDGSYPSA